MIALDLGQPQVVARFIHEGMLHEIRVDYPPASSIFVPGVDKPKGAMWFPEAMKISPQLLGLDFSETHYLLDRVEGGIAHYYTVIETMARRVDAAFMRRPLPL